MSNHTIRLATLAITPATAKARDEPIARACRQPRTPNRKLAKLKENDTRVRIPLPAKLSEDKSPLGTPTTQVIRKVRPMRNDTNPHGIMVRTSGWPAFVSAFQEVGCSGRKGARISESVTGVHPFHRKPQLSRRLARASPRRSMRRICLDGLLVRSIYDRAPA